MNIDSALAEFLLRLSPIVLSSFILTCPATSEGTSLYVLNERVIMRAERGAEAPLAPAAMKPRPTRCRAEDDDDDAAAMNIDRIVEAAEACDASAVDAEAFSAAFRVDCCRSGRS